MNDRLKVGALGGILGLFAVVALRVGMPGAEAADHKEAPLTKQDAAADINDIYAFLDPGDSTQLVLAMTVNPFTAPTANESTFFSPGVVYRINIDRTGDFIEDFVYEVRFGALDASHQQTITVNGVSAGQTTPTTLNTTATAEVVNTFTLGSAAHKVFAGLREDPFFFDFVGFTRFAEGSGTFPRTSPPDSFAGVNVSAIVLSVPVTFLQAGTTGTKFNVWATTARP